MLAYVLLGFKGLVEEFDIVDEDTSTQGVEYDYRSIMHPRVFAFGKRRTKTIVPINYTGPVANTAYPTGLDILHINIMYCEGNIYIQLTIYIVHVYVFAGIV